MSEEALSTYVRKSAVKTRKQHLETIDVDGIEVNLYNCSLQTGIVRMLFMQLKKILKNRFLVKIDTIYIGDLEFLREKGFTGLYDNNTLYIVESDSVEEMKRTVLHELSHAMEKIYGQYITEIQDVEAEFYKKRMTLYTRLSDAGYKVDRAQFETTSYNEDFDRLISTNIGFNRIRPFSDDLFMSPYAITSINEYVANGFEAFFYDRDKLASMCPILRAEMAQFIMQQKGTK